MKEDMTDPVAEIMRLAKRWAEWLNVIGSRTIVPGEMQAELVLREKIVSDGLRKLVEERDYALTVFHRQSAAAIRKLVKERNAYKAIAEKDDEWTVKMLDKYADDCQTYFDRAERAEAEAAALRKDAELWQAAVSDATALLRKAYITSRPPYIAEERRKQEEPVAWMVGNDPMTAAVYNKGEKAKAFDAARRCNDSITGLSIFQGAPDLRDKEQP